MIVVSRYTNNNMEENIDIMEAKKYLEEVMGIVEDEEFNKRRRRLLKSAKNKSSSKQSTLQSNSNLNNNIHHPSCLTQASAI